MELKMSDIAKMAGVSKAAVSFALNGKPGVSKETRKKIFKVIKEQGQLSLFRIGQVGFCRFDHHYQRLPPFAF